MPPPIKEVLTLSILGAARSKDSEPLVVKATRACQMLCCGRTHLYKLISEKELDSFLDGGSRKITVESIHRYVARQLAAAGVSS
jgi:excisionase family DNA binding protein